jgi:hypothetical protein
MTDTQERNFLGIPISGEIHSHRAGKEQRTKEEFAEILKPVLDDPTIIDFGWRQYTPYFNDGDTCVFGAHGLWVRAEKIEAPKPPESEEERCPDCDELDSRCTCDEGEEFDFDYGSKHNLGKVTHDGWGTLPDGSRGPLNERYEGPDEERYRRVEKLARAIEGGSFDHALLELFGDHATIHVRKTGITVEEYSHD